MIWRCTWSKIDNFGINDIIYTCNVVSIFSVKTSTLINVLCQVLDEGISFDFIWQTMAMTENSSPVCMGTPSGVCCDHCKGNLLCNLSHTLDHTNSSGKHSSVAAVACCVTAV